MEKKVTAYRKEKFNKLKLSPNDFNEDKKASNYRKEFVPYSNLILLYFVHNLIRKRYGKYTPEVARHFLNNQLGARIEQLFKYVVRVLSFSEKLHQ